jgi:hypothetical protein
MRSSKTENRETALARLHVLAAILLAFQPLFGLLCAFFMLLNKAYFCKHFQKTTKLPKKNNTKIN